MNSTQKDNNTVLHGDSLKLLASNSSRQFLSDPISLIYNYLSVLDSRVSELSKEQNKSSASADTSQKGISKLEIKMSDLLKNLTDLSATTNDLKLKITTIENKVLQNNSKILNITNEIGILKNTSDNIKTTLNITAIHDCINAIKAGDLYYADVKWKQIVNIFPDGFKDYLKEIIIQTYTNFDQTVFFIDNIKSSMQQLLGYNFLLDTMESKNEFYSSNIFKLGYFIKKLMENGVGIAPIDQLAILKERLPGCVINVIWNPVILKAAPKNEFLYLKAPTSDSNQTDLALVEIGNIEDILKFSKSYSWNFMYDNEGGLFYIESSLISPKPLTAESGSLIPAYLNVSSSKNSLYHAVITNHFNGDLSKWEIQPINNNTVYLRNDQRVLSICSYKKNIRVIKTIAAYQSKNFTNPVFRANKFCKPQPWEIFDAKISLTQLLLGHHNVSQGGSASISIGSDKPMLTSPIPRLMGVRQNNTPVDTLIPLRQRRSLPSIISNSIISRDSLAESGFIKQLKNTKAALTNIRHYIFQNVSTAPVLAPPAPPYEQLTTAQQTPPTFSKGGSNLTGPWSSQTNILANLMLMMVLFPRKLSGKKSVVPTPPVTIDQEVSNRIENSLKGEFLDRIIIKNNSGGNAW